tara:strand:- start:1009 stop:1188 length:180 start_codon:yes stop_codon:yes gene_type:complete
MESKERKYSRVFVQQDVTVRRRESGEVFVPDFDLVDATENAKVGKRGMRVLLAIGAVGE